LKQYLIIALTIGFILVGFNAYQEAKPTTKAPIYQTIKKFSPYYLEKRFGGLEILSKGDPNFKEKPDNMELFHRLEFLEREWGKKHLKLVGGKLHILDKNGSTIQTLPISQREDMEFLHSFYGI